MKNIGLGTIGSGFIVDHILDAVAGTEGIGLAAVYSRSEEKGSVLAARHGGARVYTRLEEMLADPMVNTVYVASPNSLHFEHCRTVLMNGKHVICEKPMCTSGAQVRELLALARENGLFLVDATPTAFLPNFEILKRNLERVGRVRLVTCNYSQYSSRYDQLQQYLRRSGSSDDHHVSDDPVSTAYSRQEEQPSASIQPVMLPNVFNPEFAGGCLMDINYYNVYLMVSLFGKPRRAMYFPNMCGSGVDTSGIIVLQYPDLVCQGTGAKDAGGVNSAQIEGELGYIYVDGGSNGIADVRLVLKEHEEHWNEQTAKIPGESNRWFYEVQGLVKMMLEDDKERSYRQVLVAADVMDVIEDARREAGIRF